MGAELVSYASAVALDCCESKRVGALLKLRSSAVLWFCLKFFLFYCEDLLR